MNTFEMLLLLAAIAVGGAGVVTLVRAVRLLKSSSSK